MQFNFIIQYQPRKLGAKPDTLTRRSEDLSKKRDDSFQQMVQIVLKPHNLEFVIQKDLIAAPLHIKEIKKLLLEELIDHGYQEDPLPNHVLQLLVDKANYSKDLTIADCTIINSRLYYQDRFYVLIYYKLCFHLYQLHYNSPYAGYLRTGNTYKQLHQNYYWPNMQGFIRKYVCHFNICRCNKGFWFKKQIVFQPLSVPDQR